ncbi:MAG: DUF1289 domain-containing protein [Methylophilaceae bacterium]
MSNHHEFQSPCIGVCAMDDLTGLCQGCYRTADEIQQWWELSVEQQHQIVVKAKAREAQLFD